MKKIFTLFTMALMAMGVNAQNTAEVFVFADGVEKSYNVTDAGGLKSLIEADNIVKRQNIISFLYNQGCFQQNPKLRTLRLSLFHQEYVYSCVDRMI